MQKFEIQKPKATKAYMFLLTDFFLELCQVALTSAGIEEDGIVRFETNANEVIITTIGGKIVPIPWEALELIFRYTVMNRRKYNDVFGVCSPGKDDGKGNDPPDDENNNSGRTDDVGKAWRSYKKDD